MRFGSVCSGIEAASVACKPCTNCHEIKSLNDYHKSSKSSDGKASWCKACANAVARKSRKRTYDKESKRKWQIKSRYGLTPACVDEMLESQGGKCALCEKELSKPHIDHCHNTGRVRGLLCHKCNIRLGGWDDVEWQKKALSYMGIAP